MLKTIFVVTYIDCKGNIHVGVEHFTYSQAHFSKNRSPKKLTSPKTSPS